MPPSLQGFTPTFAQAWWLLGVAIVFEIAGTVCMRLSEGFTRATPSLLLFAFYAISFGLNTFVIKVLGLSVVYAVWSGVGIVLITAVGWFMFGQKLDTPALLGMALIIAGVIVMNVFSGSGQH